jgi:integrase
VWLEFWPVAKLRRKIRGLLIRVQRNFSHRWSCDRKATLRHSYRSWLDAVGTGVAVQQKLMRHSDIRTTMNIYEDVVTDEMERAQSKGVAWRWIARQWLTRSSMKLETVFC